MRSAKSVSNIMPEDGRKRGLNLITVLLIVAIAIVSITFAASAAGFSPFDESEDPEPEPVSAMLKQSLPLQPTRTFPITLCIDGESRVLQVLGGTVAELLELWGVAIETPDYTKPSKETMLAPDMTVEIIRVTTEQLAVDTPIPFETKRVASVYVWKGKEVVSQEGKDGTRTSTYDVTYENGTEVSRVLLDETTTKEPVDQIVEYGTGGEITTPDGEVIKYVMKLNVKATAYTTEGYDRKTTATGTVARVGAIAVDPRVISYGTRLYVTSKNGTSWVYGLATAEDTGGAIKGNKVDLFFDTRAECFQFGRKNATVYILESE